MTQTPPDPTEDRCIICGGTRQEHGPQTRHAFTLTPGDLRPRDELPKRQQQSAQPFNRLVNLLITKGIIDEQEALSVYGVDRKSVEETVVKSARQ